MTAQPAPRRPACLEQRLAWYAILAVPALVPAVVGKLPFTGLPSLTYSFVPIPKLFVFALLVSASALMWAAATARRRVALRSVPSGWLLLTFLALASVSTATALSPEMAFFGGHYHSIGLLAFLLTGALFALIVQSVTTRERLRHLSWSATLGGVLVAGVALLEMLGLQPLDITGVPGWMLDRGASLLGNPDATGSYLVVPAVLAAGLALSEGDPRARAAAWAASGLTSFVLIGTLTRGAWLGAAAGVVVLGIAVARSGVDREVVRRVLIRSGAGAIVVVVAFGGRIVSRMADIADASTAGGGRLVLWRDALAVIADRPFFGTGPDSYRLGWYGIRSQASVALSGLGSVTDDPHNTLLLLAATVGVPAALAASALLASVLAGAAKPAFARGAKRQRMLYAGWWSALAGLTVAQFFGTNTAAAMAMAGVAAGVLVSPRSREVVPSLHARRALACAATGFSVVALAVATMTIAADIRLRQAHISPDKATLAADAARIAPWHPEARYQAALAQATVALAALEAGSPSAEAAALAAERRIGELVDRDPHEYAGHALKAFYLSNAGLSQGPAVIRRAVAASERALEVYPVSAEAAYLKAFSEYNLGDYAAAAATLEAVWDVDHRYAEAGIVYARSLSRLGRDGEASSVVRRLQEWLPDNTDVDRLAEEVAAGSGSPG
ncbi:MAG: O-antigen ligase family protein [Coriobacteriia bacterium]|nr:O-antigen ligase family protein [Coriobacteriia bacterium]